MGKDVEKKEKKGNGTLAKVAIGAGIGAAVGVGVGVLIAPKSGKETRADLKKKIDELVQKVKEIDLKNVRDSFDKKIKKLENDIRELDKEKVLAAAKAKSKKIKEKAEELVELAKKKGNEELVKISEDVRKKAIDVTKSVLEKLEEK